MLPLQQHPSNPLKPSYFGPLKPIKVKTVFLSFSRFFFVFPLNEKLETTLLLKIHCLASQMFLIIFGACVLIYIRNKEILYRKSTDSISHALLYISESLCSVVLLMHNVIIMRNSEILQKCVNLSRVRMRETFGVHTIILLVSCVVKYIFSVCLFFVIRKPWRYLEEIFFIIIDVQTFLIVLQFCFFVSVMKTRLSSLAEEVGPHRADCLQHFELVSRLRALNDTYGWQLLAVVFRIFSQSLVGMYWIVQASGGIYASIYGGEWSHILSICSSTSVVVTGAYNVWLLINLCTSTSEVVSHALINYL